MTSHIATDLEETSAQAEAELLALKAENALLREFFDAWVFMHRTISASDPAAEDQGFQKLRRDQAVMGLTNAAKAVTAHIRANTVAH